jgi:hypothetical protein
MVERSSGKDTKKPRKIRGKISRIGSNIEMLIVGRGLGRGGRGRDVGHFALEEGGHFGGARNHLGRGNGRARGCFGFTTFLELFS